jgi:acetyl esterase/lipase
MSTSQPPRDILRPKYDPAVISSLEEMKKHSSKTVEEIRKHAQCSLHPILERFPDLVHTEYQVPGQDASNLVTISAFKSKKSTNPARPAVYFLHVGGQIAGNRFSALDIAMSYYTSIDVVTIAVEYRLAPEHPAPAALQDSYAGLVWVADNAAELSIDPGKIMVMGGSGGAPIAAGCAILAKRNNKPRLLAQMLMTPMIDDRGYSVSAKQYELDGPWCGVTNRMAWDCVLGSHNTAQTDVDILVVPGRATVQDLRGLPPTFIDVGEAEVFRDDAVSYASKLWEGGVSTELHVWKGAFHGFDFLAAEAPVAKAAVSAKVSWISRTFSGSL